jgi:hypothetical protein
MTLAMNAGREMVRMAIKQKGLDADEWPASRVSQVAKDLLASRGENGAIVQAARKQVEAEREAAKDSMTEGGDAEGRAAQ